MELDAYVSSMASQTEMSNTGKRNSIRKPKNPPKAVQIEGINIEIFICLLGSYTNILK